jgi:DNA-binding transcriptional MerR regulator
MATTERTPNAAAINAIVDDVLERTSDWDFESVTTLINTLRDACAGELREQAGEVAAELRALDEVYAQLTGVAGELCALAGAAGDASRGLPAAFTSATPSPERSPSGKPEAWYRFEILKFIKQFKGAGCATKRIVDLVRLEGGDADFAVSRVLPGLRAEGLVAETEPGWWNVTNFKPAAWYTNRILEFIKQFKGAGCTTARIRDMILVEGGDGSEACATHLPAMRDAGLIAEAEPGMWNTANFKPEAWYDERIVEFVRSFHGHGCTTKRIQDMILVEGGDGSAACAEHLPRLRETGVLVEPEPGLWRVKGQRKTKPAGKPNMTQHTADDSNADGDADASAGQGNAGGTTGRRSRARSRSAKAA